VRAAAITLGLTGCTEAPTTSCTSLWPDLPLLVPGRTLQSDFEADHGSPDTSTVMSGALTPGGKPNTVVIMPTYVFGAGTVQLFFDSGRLATAIVTPTVRFPTDSMRQLFGPPDSLAPMMSEEGVAFEHLFWWSDSDRLLRLAVSWENSVGTLYCGRVGW
ncbi:MAG: hypothetical protein ACE5FP_09000, partial [Gemmatimonadota bacterium]